MSDIVVRVETVGPSKEWRTSYRGDRQKLLARPGLHPVHREQIWRLTMFGPPLEIIAGRDTVWRVTVEERMPRLTLEQAKGLERGTILYHREHRNADGTPQRWKVNGRPKTWKRAPGRVQVPVKHGLYSFDYITEDDLHLVSLEDGSEFDDL